MTKEEYLETLKLREAKMARRKDLEAQANTIVKNLEDLAKQKEHIESQMADKASAQLKLHEALSELDARATEIDEGIDRLQKADGSVKSFSRINPPLPRW